MSSLKRMLGNRIPEKMTRSKLYVFGAGMVGMDILKTLLNYNFEVVFIDNNTSKQNTKYKGCKVISLDSYIENDDGYIIVAMSAINAQIIEDSLDSVGLKKGEDYCTVDEFRDYYLPIVSTYLYNRSYVSLAQITLTERCSLKCKKCAHACYAVGNDSEDLLFERVCFSADSFFNNVDFCSEFVLIGGEPLLYKEIDRAVNYIGERYSNKIGVFSITTNGTIIPSDRLIEASKKHNVLFRISNYEKTLPRLKESYKKITDLLEEKGVEYRLAPYESNWMDYGFEYVDRKATPDELKKVFSECKTPCREVRDNKFYFCVMARTVSDNLKLGIGTDDYLDLSKLNEDNYKEEILAFQLGYFEKGYLDMCNHCHGADAKNYPIPVAEQV